jgi:hypothetical protein
VHTIPQNKILSGRNIANYTTKSSFECLSLCVEEPSCGGVQTRLISKNESECLIKSDNSTTDAIDTEHENFTLFRMKT